MVAMVTAHCSPYVQMTAGELTNGVINTAFLMLYKVSYFNLSPRTQPT